MTALLYLIQIYRVVDRFKGSGFRVQGCGSGFAANSNGALRAGPLSLSLAGKALIRKYRFTRPTSAPSGHFLPKKGGRKKGLRVSS